MTTVVVSPAALADLLEVDDYLRGENPLAADRVGVRLEEAIANLAQFPERCPIHPQARGARFEVVRPYLIFYRYRADLDEVSIRRVVHGARDLPVLLAP